MSVLSGIAGAAVGGIWKVAAIVLLIVLALTGGGVGAGWWLAAHDRNAARTELAAEKVLSGQYRDALAEQNRAVQALADQKRVADARGLAAQQLATANGKRFDQALARVAGSRQRRARERCQWSMQRWRRSDEVLVDSVADRLRNQARDGRGQDPCAYAVYQIGAGATRLYIVDAARRRQRR